MDLLWLVVFGVLGVILDKVFGHQIKFAEQSKNVPRYTKILYGILLLTTGIGALISLCACPLTIFFLAAGGQQPWQEWVYLGLFVLLPFFNIGIWIWARRPLTNLWIIIAALGMVISANLPIWLEFGRTVKQGPVNFDTYTAIFAFCLHIFLTSVVLFMLARKLGLAPVQHKPRKHFTKEPVFLNAFDQTKTHK